jgi:threonine synthase
MGAIDDKYKGMDDFDLIDELQKVSGTKIPKAVEEIRTAAVLHDTVCETADMQKTVEKILNL